MAGRKDQASEMTPRSVAPALAVELRSTLDPPADAGGTDFIGA
jgi:hypothetical protein